MTINIEKMRTDMARDTNRFNREGRFELWKIAISAFVAGGVVVGAFVAALAYANKQPPQPIIVYAAPSKS